MNKSPPCSVHKLFRFSEEGDLHAQMNEDRLEKIKLTFAQWFCTSECQECLATAKISFSCAGCSTSVGFLRPPHRLERPKVSAPRFFTGHAAHEGVVGCRASAQDVESWCSDVSNIASFGWRPCRGRVTQRFASFKASILAADPSASKGSKCSCQSWRSGKRCGSSGAFWKLLASRVGGLARLLRPGHW